MTDLVAIHGALVKAGASVPGVRGYDDPAALFDPPAWLVSPPRIEWGAYSTGLPSAVSFVGFLLVKADDRAVRQLERLAVLVGQKIYAAEDVDAVISGPAFPGVWRTGQTELPCYEFPLECSL